MTKKMKKVDTNKVDTKTEIKNQPSDIELDISELMKSGKELTKKADEETKQIVSKPRRGRPKKVVPETSPVVNEDSKSISMSANKGNGNDKTNTNKGLMTKEQYNAETEVITLNQTRRRWASIFSSYSSLGMEAIQSAWAKGYGQLNNPWLQNFRIKQINAQAHKLDQDDLQDALEDPENSEIELSAVSMYLYYTNYVYHTLMNLQRETPMFKWYATPQYVDVESMDKETFKKESQFVDKIMKALKPQLTFKTITSQVSLEGKSSYLTRVGYNKNKNDVDFFVLQKLNTDMVKLTGFGSKQQFIASFNMIIFLQPAYDVSQYPKYIQDVWTQMNTLGIITSDDKGQLELNPMADLPAGHTIEWTGKYYMYWVQLPQDLCYTFYSDGAHPMAFPDTIGLFNDLNDLADYRWLQANLLSKGVNSILTAQVPMVKDPKPGADSTAISPDTVLGYQDLFSQTVSSNILPFFAPFTNYELHTLENQPESLDIIYDRTRDLIATSGLSALLTISDKPSIASVKAAELIQASKMEYLTRQFEEFINNVINKEFELKNKWKITLWGDIFYIRDDFKDLKELALGGVEGVIPKMLSALDMSLEDYMQSKAYMDALGFKIEKSFEIQKMELQNDLNKDSMEKSNELNIKATKESAKINAQYNKNNDNNNSNSSKSSTSKTSVKSTKVSTGTKADEEKSASETGMGNKVGRPSVSDSDVENDSTGASKDAGNNTSDIKEFSSEFSVGFVSPNEYKVDIPDDKDEFVRPVCAKCGKELERDEEYICDECLENYFGERLGDL